MCRARSTAFVIAALLAPLSAAARPVSELGGAYKWGMSPEGTLRMLTDQLHAKYSELVAHESDAYKQDQLRLKEGELGQQLRESLIKFDGVSESSKSWGTSLVQQEFAQRNDESMLVVSEPKLRRFLFFWQDKLYKQVIVFDSEHAAGQGSTFEDFTRVLQDRYGPAEMRFLPLRTHDDDMKLDHLEWPATGDYQLFASDQTDIYDNYYLVLFNPSVAAQVDTRRKARGGVVRAGSALIDAATAPASSDDRNEDIVDRITRRK
jgi:hypothetical protein